MSADRDQQLWDYANERADMEEALGLRGGADEEYFAEAELSPADVLDIKEHLRPGQLPADFGIGLSGRREESRELGKD